MKHVFITGCPRSGTTMLASILGNCANSVVTPESDFFFGFMFKYLQNDSDQAQKEDYITFLNKNYRFGQWGLAAEGIEIPEGGLVFSNYHTVIENTVEYYASENMASTINEEITRIDHTPSNILHFEALNRLFPESKFVFIVRDPRAVYASVKKLDWGANSALRLSDLWSQYVVMYYSLKQLHPKRVLLVKYEDIVSDPASFVQQICIFTGLDYEESILKGGGFKLPKYTAAQHTLVGKTLTKDRIDKWKQKISEKEVLLIESKCNLLMSSFGYHFSRTKRYKVGVKDRIKSLVRESHCYLINKVKKKKREKISA
ncbi:MAG: sulfotransferase [Bacteroidota bacterium]